MDTRSSDFYLSWINTLENLLREKKIILVFGKGGVGRSTLAGSLALASKRLGRSPLLLEVEYSGFHSSLAQHFGKANLSATPELHASGVYLAKITAHEGHRAFLTQVLKWQRLADRALQTEALRIFLETIPSLRELGMLYHVLDLQKRVGDLVIIDLPATGHALSFVELPEKISKLLPLGPIHRAIESGKELFFDQKNTGSIIVTLPEALPLRETLDLLEKLGGPKSETPVEAVIINRVPEHAVDTGPTVQVAALTSIEKFLFRTASEANLEIGSFKQALKSQFPTVSIFKCQESQNRQNLMLSEQLASQILSGEAL